MAEIAHENSRMSEPLMKALQDVDQFKHELRKYEVEKEELRATKGQLSKVEETFKALKWENEVSQSVSQSLK